MSKKTMFVSLAACLFLIMFTSMSFAYTATTVGGSGYGPYEINPGGEFTLLVGDGLEWVLNGYVNGKTKNVQDTNGITLSGSFQTFCVEEQEYIYPYSMSYATISDGAIQGGVGGKDPLSVGAAWLYYNFATGNLTDYDYANHSTAAALQNTIWGLEGEASDPGAGNAFRDDILNQFTNSTNAMADNNGQYKVAVLNLWADPAHTQLRQDQLVVTPIPGALLLLGPGLIGLVGIRRRMAR
jgi:hypothetical protein